MQKIITQKKNKTYFSTICTDRFFLFFFLIFPIIFVCIECCIGDIKVAQYLWERVYFVFCFVLWLLMGCVHFHILGYFVSDYGLVSDYIFVFVIFVLSKMLIVYKWNIYVIFGHFSFQIFVIFAFFSYLICVFIEIFVVR